MSYDSFSAKDRVLIITGLMLGTFLSALDLLIIATAVPDIAGDLGNLSQTAWIFTSYLLGVGVVMPVWGKLGDVYGRSRMYVLAILLFIGSSLLAGAAVSIYMLIAGRLMQGIAAGAMLALPQAIIGDIVPPRDRGVYFSSLTSVWAMSAVLGPLVGGGLVDTIGWRWIFYINLPIGFTSIGLLFLTGMYHKLGKIKTISHNLGSLVSGAGLLILALGIITLAASLAGDTWELDSSWFIVSLILGAGFMAVFVYSQLRAKEQIVPFNMFSYRVVTAGSITNFFFGLGNFGMAIILPLYAQVVNGVSATLAGLTLAPVAIGIFFSTLAVGTMIKRSGHYRIYPILGCCIYILGVFLLLSMDQDTSRPVAMLFALITGIGNGMLQPVIVLSIQNAVPRRDLGAATSLATTSRSLGQTIGSAVLGAIISSSLIGRLTDLGLDADTYLESPDEIQNLSGGISDSVISAYHSALDLSLYAVAGFVFIALLGSLFIPQESLDVPEPSIPGQSVERFPGQSVEN